MRCSGLLGELRDPSFSAPSSLMGPCMVSMVRPCDGLGGEWCPNLCSLAAFPSQPKGFQNRFPSNYLLTQIFENMYLLFFGCAGSSLLHMSFLQLLRAGSPLQLWCAGVSLWWLLWLWSMSSVVVAQGLGFSLACEIFLVSLAFQGRFLTTGKPGKPLSKLI